MTLKKLIKLPLLVLFFTLQACDSVESTRIYQQTSLDNYEDTLQNLDIAISEHNYRIIHRSNIGQAIRDRGDKNYPLSTVISFCNISYAREMMDINSDLINDMPCIVTVREEKNSVVVGTKLMIEDTANSAQNEFAVRINSNLKSIIEATVE